MENKTKLIIMAIFGLVVIILAWYVLFELSPQGPQPQPYVTNITIINSNGTNVNGVYIINGSVQNKNPFNITVVDINATGFSSNGSVVNTGAVLHYHHQLLREELQILPYHYTILKISSQHTRYMLKMHLSEIIFKQSSLNIITAKKHFNNK